MPTHGVVPAILFAVLLSATPWPAWAASGHFMDSTLPTATSSFTRALQSEGGPVSFLRELGGAERSDGRKRYEGTVVGYGTASDPTCQNDAYICFQTEPCRRVRRRALQAQESPQGVICEVVLDRVCLTVCIDCPPDCINCPTSCCSPCETCYIDPKPPSVVVPGPPKSPVPPYFPGIRRRSLLAEGEGFEYELTLTLIATEEEARTVLGGVVNAFNTGQLDVCAGYSYVPGTSNPIPPKQIKPVQRYLAEAGVRTLGKSCSDWAGRGAKSAYVSCASSLTGQLAPFVSASCTEWGMSPTGKRKLVVRLVVPKTGTAAQAQEVLDSLTGGVSSGALAKYLLASGVRRYKPRAIASSALSIPNPKTSP